MKVICKKPGCDSVLRVTLGTVGSDEPQLEAESGVPFLTCTKCGERSPLFEGDTLPGESRKMST
jgi:hypothetical protein